MNIVERKNKYIVEIDDEITNLDSMSLFKRDIKNIKLLSKDEAKELLIRFQKENDIEARNELILKNIRLSTHWASKYLNYGLDFLELVDEGIFGIERGLLGFNTDKYDTLSTYLIPKINEAMKNAVLNTSKNNEISRGYFEIYKKYKRLINESLIEGIDINLETIANKLNISARKLNEILLLFGDLISLNDDDTITEKEKINFIADDFNLEQSCLSNIYIKEILETDILKEREKEILILRFGLIDGIPRSQEEVGSFYGVSRQCIQKLEKSGLKKIENSKFFNEIKNEIELKLAIKKLNNLDRKIINLYLGYYEGKRIPRTEKMKKLEIKDVSLYYEIINDIMAILSRYVPNVSSLCENVRIANSEKINHNNKEEQLLSLDLNFEIKRLVLKYLYYGDFKSKIVDLTLEEIIVVILCNENFNNKEICNILKINEEKITKTLEKYNHELELVLNHRRKK